MHPKAQKKLADWLIKAFEQVGDFCQVTLSVGEDDMVLGEAPWPTEALQTGTQVAAVHRVRGEEGHTIGIAGERGLWIYLSGMLMMLMPAGIEEQMEVTSGPLEEDDPDMFGELFNVMTGVLNQAIQESSLVEPLQLELLGLFAPEMTPEGANFTDEDMVTLALKIVAPEHEFKATVYLTQDLIDRWFAPLLAAQPKDVNEDQASNQSDEAYEAEQRGAGQNGDGSVKPWLVVDGSDLDRHHLTDLLQGQELPTRGTRSVKDAVTAIKATWCEGIFLDCAVADGDGIDFLKRLRGNFLTDDLPVIITVREATRDVVMNAIRSGATHVLVKPITEDALSLGLERAARRHGLNQ